MLEYLIPIGTLIILVGIAIVIIGIILAARSKEAKAEGGFAIWIGPIPIIGATSKTMFYTVLVLSVIVLIVFLLLYKKVFI
jgi:uncharacterized membrane protein